MGEVKQKTLKFNLKDENSWNSFKKELLELAKKYNIEVPSLDSFKDPVLIHLSWSGWRGFSEGIHESFVIENESWKKLYPIMKQNEIYFGEICGNHSEVFVKLEDEDIREIKSHSEIDNFLNQNGKWKKGNHSFLDTLFSNLYDDENLDNVIIQVIMMDLKN